MSEGVSSYSANRRRSYALRDDIDRSAYAVGQTLASVVNDPRAAAQPSAWFGSDASQREGPPPLDPTKYPPVSRQDVEAYISLVRGRYERFMRDRQQLEAFKDHSADAGVSEAEQLQAPQHPQQPQQQQQQQQGEAFVAAMQQVPLVYFQEGFDDNMHDFFGQFVAGADVEELHGHIEDLNKYLDVVEGQLLREVAARSASFFTAAASLQHLRGALGDAVASVRSLRAQVTQVDTAAYSSSLTVAALQARRRNLTSVLDIAKLLEELSAVQAALDCLLEGGDYAGALELLEQAHALLAHPQLAGLAALRHVAPKVAETAEVVEGLLARDFIAAAAHADLSMLVDELVAHGGLLRGSSDGSEALRALAVTPSPSAADESLSERLLPLVSALHRCGRLPEALLQYRDLASAEVKAGVREVTQRLLPVLLTAGSADAGDGGGGGAGGQLVDQLQMLHHAGFMELLAAVGAITSATLDQVQRVGAVVAAALAACGAPAPQASAAARDVAAALQQAADVGQGRWVKLLAARTSAHMRLKLYELRQLLDAADAAAAAAEARGAKPLPSFRAAMQAQSKGYLDTMHSRSAMQLQHLLDAEQWVVVEVPSSFQAIVDRLNARCVAAAVAGSGDGAAAATRGGALFAAPSPAAAAANGGEAAAAATATAPVAAATQADTGAAAPALLVAGRSFHLVNATLMLLKLVDEYLALNDILPHFGAEIVHRLLELLKLFNTQTCQLVLGAGAMRTAGLRSISAKQLALSAQSVAAVAALVPLLRACCLALVSQPRRALLLPEFDRLAADLTTHTDEVHSKLVDIMQDRLQAALHTLPQDLAHNTTNLDAPNPTVVMLARQMNTLKSVLSPILSSDEVAAIFGAVTRAYSEALSDAFEGLLARGADWEPVVHTNALFLLQAFKELPLGIRGASYYSRLSTFFTKHFGLIPGDGPRAAQSAANSADGAAAAGLAGDGAKVGVPSAPAAAAAAEELPLAQGGGAPAQESVAAGAAAAVAPEAGAAAAAAPAAVDARAPDARSSSESVPSEGGAASAEAAASPLAPAPQGAQGVSQPRDGSGDAEAPASVSDPLLGGTAAQETPAATASPTPPPPEQPAPPPGNVSASGDGDSDGVRAAAAGEGGGVALQHGSGGDGDGGGDGGGAHANGVPAAEEDACARPPAGAVGPRQEASEPAERVDGARVRAGSETREDPGAGSLAREQGGRAPPSPGGDEATGAAGGAAAAAIAAGGSADALRPASADAEGPDAASTPSAALAGGGADGAAAGPADAPRPPAIFGGQDRGGLAAADDAAGAGDADADADAGARSLPAQPQPSAEARAGRSSDPLGGLEVVALTPLKSEPHANGSHVGGARGDEGGEDGRVAAVGEAEAAVLPRGSEGDGASAALPPATGQPSPRSQPQPPDFDLL